MTKIVLKFVVAGIATVSLICLASAEAKQKPHTKAHPVTRPAVASSSASDGEWTPNSSLLGKLAPETQFEAYTLRLPPSLTQVDKTAKLIGSAIFKQSTYAGQKRSDGTCTFITVLTLSNLTASVSAGGQAQLDRILDNVEHETTDGKPNLVISSREYGVANGLPLVREYFKFSFDPGKNAALIHGFHYACITGTSAIMFTSFDAEPYNKASLPLSEASALTMHKQ